MTLLETLIAMSLLSLLLVFFFGIFRELAFIQDEDQKDYKMTFYDNYAQLRLNYLFSHLYNENSVNSTKLFNFYMKNNEGFIGSPSLVLIYNNGVRQNPYNSGFLLGRLYVDKEKMELRLANWPTNLKNPHPYFFQEVLLPNVESMRFEFLSTDESNGLKGIASKAPIEKRGEWQSTWDQSYKELPIMIKIYLKLKDIPEEKTYTFVLPSHRYGIKLQAS